MQNKRRGRLTPGGQDHDPTTHAPPKQARNTNKPSGPHSHSQNSRKTRAIRKAPGQKRRGGKTTIQQRKHRENTHETHTRARDDHRNKISTSKRSHIIGQNSKSSTFNRDQKVEGRRDGQTDGHHKFVRPTLATLESSRARSFARSHARTQRKRKRNRNRFPGSGVG